MPSQHCRTLIYLSLITLMTLLSGCSSLTQRDALRIQLVSVEPLPGQSLEMRVAVTLRIQNPNDQEVRFNGVALDLQVNSQPLLSGVSDQSGEIPRFGEALLRVPMTLSAYAALRQAWGIKSSQNLSKGLPYELSGKLGGGLLGTVRFKESGLIDWPQTPPH